ncbi:MAG: hypothetical protein GY793_11590, partial [Proteobacteria bacterium]|nr:hypothetical protein [Pseudomonadota bacterium]
MDYITKTEALEILNISSYQHLRRLTKKLNIQTKSLGVGKATLYLKSDICGAVVEGKDTQKFAPKKPKEVALEKKVKKQTKATELKQKKKEVEEASSTPLNNIGQSEYLRVEKELKDLGLYEFKDRAILLAYAVCYQNYMFYTNLSAQLDHTTTDEGGNLK